MRPHETERAHNAAKEREHNTTKERAHNATKERKHNTTHATPSEHIMRLEREHND